MDAEFFYDYRSPYSYLAATQLDTPGVRIVFEPVNIPVALHRSTTAGTFTREEQAFGSTKYYQGRPHRRAR
jgi:2-hydroxychromene-2-carboxylate isomerase